LPPAGRCWDESLGARHGFTICDSIGACAGTDRLRGARVFGNDAGQSGAHSAIFPDARSDTDTWRRRWRWRREHANAQSDADRRADTHGLSHSLADAHRRSHSDANGNADAHADRHTDSIAHTDRRTDADPDGNPNPFTHAHAGPDPFAVAHSSAGRVVHSQRDADGRQTVLG
jgi:hypothetical protein